MSDTIAFAPIPPRYVTFQGGPLGTLGTITPGNNYVPGTYPNVPFTGGSGVGGKGTFVVGGGGSVSSVVITDAGAPITALGAIGYLIDDVLSVSAASLGGTGSGFSVPVTGQGSYSWPVPAGRSLYLLDAVGGGTGGAAGGPVSGSGGPSGGGGGGSGVSIDGLPIQVTPGSTLTITVPAKGKGGVFGGAAATVGGLISIVGANNPIPLTLIAGVPTAGSGTTGGTGGAGQGQGQGAGGVAGTIGTGAALLSFHQQGGNGGGGGGPSASPAGSGARSGAYSAGSLGTGNAAGGGGGASHYGTGGRGGGGTTPSAGAAPTLGFGGGGGGGGPGQPGGDGAPGFVGLR